MAPSHSSTLAVLAACLLHVVGCSDAVKTDTKPDPMWSCIGSVLPLQSGGMVTFHVQLLDQVSNMPITSDLSAKLCDKLDPTCASPLGSPLMPDSTGTVGATVASDFDGYLDLTDTTGTYLPAVIFIDVVAVAQNSVVPLVSKTAESGLATSAMVTLDPTASLLLVPTVDCTATRAAGVSVSMSPVGSETGFYFIDDSIMPTATATDSSGNAGFLDVKAPHTVTISGTVGGKELGKVTTLVRPGGMTYQILRPTNPS